MASRVVRACLSVLALVALALGATGCGGFNLLSTQEEIALGQQIAANVEKDAKLYADPTVVHYVQEIGARIAKASDRQDVVYHYKVIEDHNTVNAFALPGGFIYLYTGLLRYAETEAELAGVIAHETGHVAARHSAEHISAEIGLNILLTLVLGENPGVATKLGGEVLKGVGFSRMSQRDEYEADELGIKLMKKAGYDPAHMVAFLRKLDASHESTPSAFAQLFATHPLTKDRIARADALVKDLGPGGRVAGDTYAHRMGRLKAEKAPPKPKEAASSGSSSYVETRPAPAEAPPPGPRQLAAPVTGRPQERPPMTCRNLTKGNVLAAHVEVARTAAARRKGLLGRAALAPGHGLLLTPCASVHTLGMKFPIDIVFLDKRQRVAKILRNVQPGAVHRQCLKARSTLELPAGTAAARRLEVGDQVRLSSSAEDAQTGR